MAQTIKNPFTEHTRLTDGSKCHLLDGDKENQIFASQAEPATVAAMIAAYDAAKQAIANRQYALAREKQKVMFELADSFKRERHPNTRLRQLSCGWIQIAIDLEKLIKRKSSRYGVVVEVLPSHNFGLSGSGMGSVQTVVV